MTSMVERTARKLCRLYYRGVCGPEEAPDSHWGLFVNDARELVPAILKVTDEDAKAFFDCEKATVDWFIDEYARSFLEAIARVSDAALKEGS